MQGKIEMEKPLPLATPTSAPFWEGLRQGKVRIQRCSACDAWIELLAASTLSI